MSFTDELLASKFEGVERDIGEMIQMSNRALPAIHVVTNDDHALPKGPLPDYVEHKEGVNQVGKLSAEAVVREYDAAVKEIEALGAELTEFLCANKGEDAPDQAVDNGDDDERARSGFAH